MQIARKIRKINSHPGFTLLEIILVLAISIGLVTIAFSFTPDRQRAQFTDSMKQVVGNLQAVQNDVASGLGPPPGCPTSPSCPLAPGEQLIGRAISFSTGTSFNQETLAASGSNPSITVGKSYHTFQLKLVIGTDGKLDTLANYEGTDAEKIAGTSINLPDNVGFRGYTYTSCSSIDSISQPILIAFLNLPQNSDVNTNNLSLASPVLAGAVDFSPGAATTFLDSYSSPAAQTETQLCFRDLNNRYGATITIKPKANQIILTYQ